MFERLDGVFIGLELLSDQARVMNSSRTHKRYVLAFPGEAENENVSTIER